MLDPILEPVELFIDTLIGWLKSFFIGFLDNLIAGLWNIIRSSFDKFIDFLKACFEGITKPVIEFFNRIYRFFQDVWEFVVAVWDFIKFIGDIFVWIKKFCTDVYKFCEEFVLWLIGENDEFGEWLWEQIQAGLTWFGDFVFQLWERAQDFIFENGQWLYEWLIGNLDKCIGYFVELIHSIFDLLGIQIQLPHGAMDALTQFIQWGMYFNSFVPIKEMFQLMGIYLLFVVMMSMVRFVRSLIPFFH